MQDLIYQVMAIYDATVVIASKPLTCAAIYHFRIKAGLKARFKIMDCHEAEPLAMTEAES